MPQGSPRYASLMATATLKSRRPRQTRGRPVDVKAIVPTDIERFKLLARYPLARLGYINALLGGNERATSARLGELFRAHYVYRPTQQWHYWKAHARGAIYGLDEKGKQYLAEAGLSQEPAAESKHLNNEFAHNVMLFDILMNIEIGAKKAGVRFDPVPGPILLKSQISHKFKSGKTASSDHPYHPDAAFTLTYPNGDVICCTLEADTGSETIERDGDLSRASYLKKLLQIKSVFDTRAFEAIGFKHMRALHVTNSETRRDNLIAAAAQVFGGKSKNNLFNTHPVLGDYTIEQGQWLSVEPEPNGYLFGKWQRPGMEPFDFQS